MRTRQNETITRATSLWPRFRATCFLLSALTFPGSNAHAQAIFNGFGPSFEYDQGWNPSIAISGSVAVEVHNGQGSAGPMWYHVGKVTSTGVQWGPSYEYDSGYNPQVAMVGSTVVEVHNGGTSANWMWYHVGQVAGSKIKWGPSYHYDNGNNPAVALESCNTVTNPNCGLIAVEVHNGSTEAGPMWYHVGRVNGSSIAWGPSFEYDDFGFNPSVGIQLCLTNSNASCGITVIEVHNGGGSVGPMWYRVGNWTAGNDISWGSSYEYDLGWNPKVAFYSGAYLIEVHNGAATPGPLWYHLGAWDGGTTLQIDASFEYDWGWNPSIAAEYDAAVEVHDGSGSAGPMWYHVGMYTIIQ